MDHARAVGCGGERDLLGAERLHGVETLPSALEQDADQVDDDVGVAHGRFDGTGVPHIGLDGVDLPDPAERLQVPGEVRPAHRDADAVVALGQRPDQVAAEEAGAAEDRDQRVVIGLQGHGSALLDLRLWLRGLGAVSGGSGPRRIQQGYRAVQRRGGVD